jgi:hypothetical protein
MPSLTNRTLTQVNIEKAIQKTFNIKKRHIFCETVINNGVEISGIAIASQDAHELQEFAHIEGFKDLLYDFVPNCKWSCLNLNKIKIQWDARSQQKQINGQLYNIISGAWDENKEFIAFALSKKIKVTIVPEPNLIPNIDTNIKHILVPYHTYQKINDISDIVPSLKFGKIKLDCIDPKDLQLISINRQGIYINRKYRDKVDIIEETIPAPAVPDPQFKALDVPNLVDNYCLTIYYGDNIIFQETLSL